MRAPPILTPGSTARGPGKEAKLSFIGHGLMENRSGLLVDACLTRADGHAERVAALHMIEPRADRPCTITLGADKAYDAEDFVNELRSMRVRPHVAQNNNGRSSVIDGRTTRHGGYAISQRLRKRIEEAFGWIKTVAGQEKTKLRGVDRVGFAFTFAAAADCPSCWRRAADGNLPCLRQGLRQPPADRGEGRLQLALYLKARLTEILQQPASAATRGS